MKDRTYTSTTDIERARALWEKGVFLAQRTEGFHTLQLYQLHDIYVEVSWHTHFNVALKVTTFSEISHLDPYLEAISLDGLLT